MSRHNVYSGIPGVQLDIPEGKAEYDVRDLPVVSPGDTPLSTRPRVPKSVNYSRKVPILKHQE